jgi:hypothetical protein
VVAAGACGTDDVGVALTDEPVDTGWVPGVADASTRETARKPSPTAATAEPVQAAARARVRFMAESMQPIGLRARQGRVKNGSASARTTPVGVSVAPWPSCW